MESTKQSSNEAENGNKSKPLLAVVLNQEVDLEVYGEVCCDMCNEIIHNHIDCPVCEKEYAGTDQYCDLYDEKTIECENCRSVFEKTSNSWYYECKALVVKIGENNR
jgi:hypothetical protein